MKKTCLVLLLICFTIFTVRAQTLNCNSFCVFDISIDTISGDLQVMIANWDTVDVNYPVVQVINSAGDTIGNPDGLFNLFAQMQGTTIIHTIPATVSFLPAGFTGTVVLTDPLWNISCIFNYPMNCNFAHDCNDLTVENITIDTITNLMDVTLYNNSPLWNGFVYCEMIIIRSVAPFDTLAQSHCYCFAPPVFPGFKTYTIISYVNHLPPLNEIIVIFNYGSGLCDTLPINIQTGLTEIGHTVNDLLVFPNPSDDKIIIYSNQNVNGNAEIYDVSGKFIRTIKLNEITDISTLPKGFYLIKAGDRYVKFICN